MDDIIDNIDWHFDKVKCRRIEQMMPQLMKMVEEMVAMVSQHTRTGRKMN